MARRRRIDLDTARPLRLVEEAESSKTVVIDRAASKKLRTQRWTVHGVGIAAFLAASLLPTLIGGIPGEWTMLFSLPVFLVIFANLRLSPNVVSWHVEIQSHAVTFRRLYTLEIPGVSEARDGTGTGPGVFGLGGRPDPIVIDFSSITDLHWDDTALYVHQGDQVHAFDLELTSPADIRRLGERIRQTWKQTVDSYTVSAEEAERDRRRLGALTTQRQG